MLNSTKRNLSENEKVEALKHCIDYRWSTLIGNRALSNVFGVAVLLVSPDSGGRFATLSSNSTLYPREKLVKIQPVLYLQIIRVLALLGQTILCL